MLKPLTFDLHRDIRSRFLIFDKKIAWNLTTFNQILMQFYTVVGSYTVIDLSGSIS